MTLTDFLNELDNLTDEAMVSKFLKALEEMRRLTDDPDMLRQALNEGMLDGVIHAEADDTFGTEGMRL